MTKKLVPKLRFNGFNDNWENMKIGDCLDVKYGKDYKHLNDGKYPVLGTGGVMGHVDDFLYSGESILIGRKGTIDKPTYINDSFWTVDTLFYTEIKKQFPKFLFYCISNINWLKYNEASGVPSLSANNIKSVKINVPSLNEQKKISNFLTSIDNKIELLKNKHKSYVDFKKYLMQQIFAQKLRFDFDSEWKEFCLKDIGELVTGATPSTKNPSNFAEKGFIWVTPGDITSKKVVTETERNLSSEGLMNGRKLPANSVLVTCIGATIGKICIIREIGSCNQQLNAIIPHNDFNSDFIYYLIEYNAEKLKLIAGNTATPILNKKSFGNLSFKFPELKEQIKIAGVLSSTDSYLEIIESNLNNLNKFKKGLLQQMFV